MKEVALERIQALQAEINAINQANIRNLVITKDGKPVNISQRMRDDMRFTGLTTFGLLQEINKQQR